MQYDDLVFILSEDQQYIEDMALNGEITESEKDLSTFTIKRDYDMSLQLTPYCQSIKKALDFFLFKENRKLDYQVKVYLKNELEANPSYSNYITLLSKIGKAVEVEFKLIGASTKVVPDLRIFRKVLYSLLPKLIEEEADK